MLVLLVLILTVWYFVKKFHRQVASGVSFMEVQLFDGPNTNEADEPE